MPASMATRCEIDLSPGKVTSPRIAPLPLIPIVLDMVSSAMLHNDAPCDYPAHPFMRDQSQASGIGKKGNLRADDRDHRAFNRQQTRIRRSGCYGHQECHGEDGL